MARALQGAKRDRRARRQVAEINVVPYIDVMLVLLVIFMITAPLLQLSVDADSNWYLNVGEDPESPLSREAVQRLASAVLRIDPNRQVLVAGDQGIDYGQIMQAMVTLQLAGAPEIGLMSDPAN